MAANTGSHSPSIAVQLDLETRLREHLLAGGDVRGQVHTHADRHHAQIHDHFHAQPQRNAPIVEAAAGISGTEPQGGGPQAGCC